MKLPVSEEISARARAYWTPELRAQQGVRCEAHAVGAETYNAVMKASGDAESARAAYAAATAAAYEILKKPAAFAERVGRKRFALRPAFVPGGARP